MCRNYLDVTVDGHSVRALVDSGASASVISERYRRHLRKTMLPADNQVILKVANGSHVQPLGKCILRVEIEGRIQPFEFTVVPTCSYDVILGWDFLEASQAVIDCGRSELILDDIPSEALNCDKWSLYAIEDVIIPAHSATKVKVVCHSSCQDFDVMVEKNKNLLLGKEIALPATIITLREGKGAVWVVNGQSVSKIVPCGMSLGIAEVLEKDGLNAIIPTTLRESPCTLPKKICSPTVDYSSMLAPDLTLHQKETLLRFLEDFSDLFDESRKPRKSKSTVKHRINTEHHTPVSQGAYRVSSTERRIIQEEVTKMLKKGVIQPSESPWSSPVVLVKKKDGSWRFCVDYRRLNKLTKKDVYPLPRIDDTLDCLKGAQFFSSMDLQSGYWQIEVDEADREKTAFITPEGLYEFRVMPFGLCNAPATFERMMDNLLRHLKWTMCLCYLDDVIVFSETFEEHIQRLQLIMKCVQDAGLILNSKKCLFGATKIKVLGHVVSRGEVHPDPDKIEAVSRFPTPRSIRDIRSFLGLCSYYRRFIPQFCHQARPLQELLKNNSQFVWGPEQETSFRKLKDALVRNPVLGLYDENAPIELHTDASGYGLGAVLVQIQEEKETVIAYASRTLSKAEKNYSTTERECLAVIWAITKFRPYLYGKPFRIVTDHHSLCWLAGLKDPSGRLARWALRLQEYDVTIVYKTGRKHQDADALSRNPVEEAEDLAENLLAITTDTDIAEEQKKDPEVTKLLDLQKLSNTEDRKFEIIDGVLCKKNFDPFGKRWLPVIPKHLQADILKHFHDEPSSGHLGFAKTYDRICKRFYWRGMFKTIRRYVMHCRECQRRKAVPQQPPGRLISIPPATAPFQRIGIDLLGRFPVSRLGNKWIVVCTDYSTRYAVTRALPTATAPDVAKFILEDIILKHGAPRVLITDRGQVFQSALVSELVRLCNVTHRMTTAYHPQTNGLTERFNKTLADMLSMYVEVEQKNWDEILPFVTFAYNTAKQDTTGFTPFYLLHGREAETTLDTMIPLSPEMAECDDNTRMALRAEETRQLARLRTLEAQERDRRRYDAKHRMVYYKPGDLVWIFTPVRKVGLSEKLLKRYFGPYQVLRRLSDVTYEVQDLDKSSRRRKIRDVVHVLRMKPYYNPDEQILSTSDSPPSEETVSETTFSKKEDLPLNRAAKDTTMNAPRYNKKQTLPIYSGPMTRSKTRLLPSNK